MIPRILGLCGVAGVGKSEAAAAVEDRCGHERTSFGAWLRDIATACYDVDSGRLGDLKVRLRGGDVLAAEEVAEAAGIRAKLRAIGSGMKAIDEHCFTRPALLFASSGIKPRGPIQRSVRLEKDGLWYPKIVIDDVRWPEEVKAIEALGGTVVRLVGPSIWGPEEDPEDHGIGHLEFLEIDVTKGAAATIALLRKKHPTPFVPFHQCVIDGLVNFFGAQDELDLRPSVAAEEIDVDENEAP